MYHILHVSLIHFRMPITVHVERPIMTPLMTKLKDQQLWYHLTFSVDLWYWIASPFHVLFEMMDKIEGTDIFYSLLRELSSIVSDKQSGPVRWSKKWIYSARLFPFFIHQLEVRVIHIYLLRHLRPYNLTVADFLFLLIKQSVKALLFSSQSF